MKANARPSQKAIVFGGSGFLGSHVADALSQHGYQVRIFDQKESVYLQDGQEMFAGDIMDFNTVKKAVAGCDYVYNFAGFANLDDASTKPVDTAQLNILGNLNIMEAARLSGAKRFVFASTIYVYSDKGGFYRCSKQASELYIEEYQRQYNLGYTILRFSTIYGPRANEQNSIYRYLKQALTTGTIQCAGNGDEVREYLHVRDAAKLSVDILEEAYKNKPIIISGHHPVKFKDMLAMVQEIIGKELRFEFVTRTNDAHYSYTPYSFTPKIGAKLTSNAYLDMGQGLLECLHEMHQRLSALNDTSGRISQKILP